MRTRANRPVPLQVHEGCRCELVDNVFFLSCPRPLTALDMSPAAVCPHCRPTHTDSDPRFFQICLLVVCQASLLLNATIFSRSRFLTLKQQLWLSLSSSPSSSSSVLAEGCFWCNLQVLVSSIPWSRFCEIVGTGFESVFYATALGAKCCENVVAKLSKKRLRISCKKCNHRKKNMDRFPFI